MAHKFINQIEPGQTIDDIYIVKEPILRSTTRGDLYIAMFLSDRTGQLNGRMWQATEAAYKSLPKPGFVHIKGRSELYQNNLQIVVNNVALIDSDKVDIDDFLPRTKKDTKQMFEELKQTVGQIKNSQLKALVKEFQRLQDVEGPKILHVITTKGKGLSQAEKDQITYHAPGPFDKVSGDLIPSEERDLPPKFQDVFGWTLVELADRNPSIVGVTPAMPTGTSLKYMIEKYPERAFDVGIAEQHRLVFEDIDIIAETGHRFILLSASARPARRPGGCRTGRPPFAYRLRTNSCSGPESDRGPPRS